MPKVEVSNGELIDKITILQIKLHNIYDSEKVKNINNELTVLLDAFDDISELALTSNIVMSLRSINEQLWDVEDRLRELEHCKDFGKEFVKLARRVYKLNDERSRLKRMINEVTNSRLIEEKSYA